MTVPVPNTLVFLKKNSIEKKKKNKTKPSQSLFVWDFVNGDRWDFKITCHDY